ncbi:MAG: EAL domain-containing protein [Rhizobacter sp.]
MNIVIVEDSPSIRRLIECNLRAVPGANVVGEAAGEAEAISLIRQKRPDFVVLDLSLSPGKGTNVLQQVRADGCDAKIVVLSNQPLEIFRSQCMALGADAFYDKITDIGLVVQMVREGVDRETAPAPLDLIPAPASTATHPCGLLAMPRPVPELRGSVDPDALLPRLRDAIGTSALTLAFQPQCTVDGGALSGVEALARWTDPTRGPISPEQFVPLAEENGLIDQLSRHLFDTALAERKRMLASGMDLPPLALNVSALQVRSELIDFWAEMLERHDTRPGDIELEFTETAMMSDGQEATRTLNRLRDMGFSLALDDFGVGYSSLSMLQRLPISVLKIDRSFVADIEHSPRSAAIVGSVIRLAHGLQIRVIAEGVEREQQRDILSDMGCDDMQGYLLGRPLAAPAFTRWMERHQSTPWLHPHAPATAAAAMR